MRACFLTAGLPPAGDPTGEAIRALAALGGVEVVVALTEGVPPGAEALAFGDASAMPVAAVVAGPKVDIAIATTWETTAHLFEVPAARHAFWVDHLAFRRMGTWQAERFAAQLAYDLPVDFIVSGEWLAVELAELRPDARAIVVPRGIDRARFDDAATPDGTALHVVVDDRWREDPASSDERAAVEEARAAGAELVVETLEREDDVAARGRKLAGADVVLMLSPVDGALGGPLEGFLSGATCIVSSAPDAADLVRHDENGIVADPDDVRGTARWLETLARDPARLARLRVAARETAASWPSVEGAARSLADALRHLVDEEPPPASQWPIRLMGDAIGGAAVFRQEIAALTGEVHRLQGDDAYRTAVAVRAKLQSPRLSPLRRIAAPLLRRLRG